jgi:hypothetical protein
LRAQRLCVCQGDPHSFSGNVATSPEGDVEWLPYSVSISAPVTTGCITHIPD